MAPGKGKYSKHDSYIFNRLAPSIAALPRATKELVMAYRIFSPGLDDLSTLDQIAAKISYSIENDMCGELMQQLNINSRHILRDIYKKSYAVYANEIKRMDDEEKTEAARLQEELAAQEAREQAREEEKKSTEKRKKDGDEKGKTIGEQKTGLQDDTQHNNNNNHHNNRKRCVDEEPATPNPTKRPRLHPSKDMIPDPYWLSRADAQAALDEMSARAKDLATTLLRLENFYLDTLLAAGAARAAPIPAISAALARADTQLRQDAVWYVGELQRIMAGAASAALGVAPGWAWKRTRFDNAAVRGLIERIREFGARLADTARAMDEADRLRGVLARESGKQVGLSEEGMAKMFLEDWGRQLARVSETVAHEAREYVSFRTMEAEWEEKWADNGDGEEANGEDGSPMVVTDSSDAEGDTEDGSEDELNDED